MIRLIVFLAVVAAITLFALQNLGTVPLVVLGMQLQALPLTVWVLGAIAAGAVTTLVLSGLHSGSSRRRARRPQPRRVYSPEPSPASSPASSPRSEWTVIDPPPRSGEREVVDAGTGRSPQPSSEQTFGRTSGQSSGRSSEQSSGQSFGRSRSSAASERRTRSSDDWENLGRNLDSWENFTQKPAPAWEEAEEKDRIQDTPPRQTPRYRVEDERYEAPSSVPPRYRTEETRPPITIPFPDDEDEDEDDEADRAAWEDWEEAPPPRRSPAPAPQEEWRDRPLRRDFEVPQQPRSASRSGSVYSYRYRDDEEDLDEEADSANEVADDFEEPEEPEERDLAQGDRPSTESRPGEVYDADYRVLTPPYRPDSDTSTPPESSPIFSVEEEDEEENDDDDDNQQAPWDDWEERKR